MSALSKNKSSQQAKKAESLILGKEMSALLGSSPLLRRRLPVKGASTGVRKGPGSQLTVTEEDSTIAKSTMMKKKEYKTNFKSVEQSNNNRLSVRAGSTSLYQEMGTHPKESSQPTPSQLTHHMTRKISIEPMRDQNGIPHSTKGKSSHLLKPEVSD